jgi:hypothetical protein
MVEMFYSIFSLLAIVFSAIGHWQDAWSGAALTTAKQVEALAEQCMADYDEDGWKHPAYRDGSDISLVGKV